MRQDDASATDIAVVLREQAGEHHWNEHHHCHYRRHYRHHHTRSLQTLTQRLNRLGWLVPSPLPPSQASHHHLLILSHSLTRADTPAGRKREREGDPTRREKEKASFTWIRNIRTNSEMQTGDRIPSSRSYLYTHKCVFTFLFPSSLARLGLAHRTLISIDSSVFILIFGELPSHTGLGERTRTRSPS